MKLILILSALAFVFACGQDAGEKPQKQFTRYTDGSYSVYNPEDHTTVFYGPEGNVIGVKDPWGVLH